MTKILTFLTSLFLFLSSSAQENLNRTVHYEYDANGNRIRRWVTVEEVPAPDTTGLLQHLENRVSSPTSFLNWNQINLFFLTCAHY